MAERSILKKSVRKTSLVRRIFWGMVFFIIIPLFIHTAFLYFREYQGDVKGVTKFLTMVGQDNVDFLEDTIAEKNELLNDFSLEDLRPFHAEEIAYLSSKNPLFTRVDVKTHTLWIGKNVSENSAIGIPFRLDEWIKEWRYLEQYQYPLSVALKTDDGQLAAGSLVNLEEKRVLVEQKIKGTELTLELSVPLKAVQRYEVGYYAFSVFSLLILIGLIGGGSAILFVRRLAKPFESLCHAMERISEGALHVRYQPDKMGFEINALGEQFNQTLDELFKRTEEVEKERIKRERLAQELKIGHEIQLSMLPASLPSFSGLDVAPGYKAALEVSGDFYDLFQIDPNRLLFVVADSAGKGISACLYSLGFRSALRAFANSSRDLSEIIHRANELLMLDTQDTGFFITAWIGLYDARSGALQYCSQGHPPALLKRGGHLQELSTDGIAFGVEPLTKHPTQEILVTRGDVLFLYTDGVLETHDPHNALFGLNRIKEFFLSSPEQSSEAYVASLLKILKEFSQDTPQHDDITLLMMKFFR